MRLESQVNAITLGAHHAIYLPAIQHRDSHGFTDSRKLLA